MKTITPLSPSEQSAQLATFVDFFVKEFMSEIWYLEESARGNIPGREEASMGTLFNVACGLASLVPVPGSVIALVASQKLIVASIKLASGIADAVRESEWGSQALAVAEVVKSTWDGYSEQGDDKSLIQGEDAESSGLEEGKAVDTESLSVLARWLGHQLAQRYEQALTERLSTEPEAAIMGLARTGARRSLAFLTDNGGMSGSPQERTERLLAGVVQGKPMSWYERPLKWFSKGERLAGRDDLAKEKFTAERLYVNGVWTSLGESGYVCHTHSRTEWFNAKTCAGQPKYGYVSGHIEEPELKSHTDETPDFAEWLTRRAFQPVTREMIEYYLVSSEMDVVREASITAPKTLNTFLAENFEEFPEHGQAVFRGDLSGLDLSSGNFSGSDLSGSQISGDLSYCRFDGALMYATNWREVTSAPGSQVSFARAQLGFSDLTGANFAGDVDVTQADLTCVNLTGASFGAVQQVGTKWYKAILTGVEYEGIAKAQREQLASVTAEQTAQGERFQALNDKVAALEAQVKPLLESLAAKQPVGAGAGAGGAVPAPQLEALKQQQALEELLAAQEKRLQFEDYCEEKLAQLSHTSSTHTTQIAALETNLKRVQEASAKGQAVLQSQIDQLSKRVDRVETRVDGLARRSSVIKLKVDDLTVQLSQMHLLLEEQRGLAISKDLSLADREAILEKSAIGKVLDVYCSNLSQRQKDLHYYVRPDVIERVPASKTPGEYMLAVEKGELEDSSVPLLDEVDAYLKSDDSVMLLLGEPGAGKSLFAWYGSQSRLQHYQMVLQDREPTETPWLPIVIELKNYRLSQLNGLLPEYLKSVCSLGKEELTAIQNDQKPAHKLLVVLDGFDELKQDADYDKNLLADLFQACGAQDWYAGQVKLVVTCRVRELPDAYTERQYFGQGVKQDYRRRILLPFSHDKISDYLDERTKAGASRDLELLSADEYLEALKASDSVKEMVRNPFVLRLFVEALPGLVKAGISLNQINRYDIYNGFVKQWFEREVNRLDVAHRKALGVDSSGVRNIAASFERYAGILAMEMYRQDTLVVSYDEAKQDDPAFEVWSSMDEVVAETDIDEEGIKAKLAQRYQKLKASDKRKLQIKEKIKTEAEYVAKYLDAELDTSVDHVTAQLEAFKMTSPLRQAGDQYSFIHKSFYEFFMASRILSSAGSDMPLAERVSTALSILGAAEGHQQRRLWQEPEAIDFVCEHWVKASLEERAHVKATWFGVIEATKGHSEHGVAGANAGTLLNWVNESFTYKEWRGIQMPGVDLRRAYLEGSDLRSANLAGAWLGKIQANKVDLRDAILTGVEFSERPAVALDDGCNAIAYHPCAQIIAAADGEVIRQYNLAESRWLEPPLTGHTREVTSLSYSLDGKWLASGSFDKTIRQWDASSGELRGAPLTGHTREVTSVSYSADGKWLASGSYDKTIRQWDTTSGELRGAPLAGHTELVRSVSYSGDGEWLASGDDDGTIRQWDAESGEARGAPLTGHSGGVTSVSYSVDSKWLASGSGDFTIRQWEAASGEARGAPLTGHTSCVTSVSYSRDGKWLVSGSWDRTIRQWEAASGEARGALLTGHTDYVTSVSYSNDGKLLASGSDDGTIRHWDAESGEARGAPLTGHTGGVTSLSYSADGKWLASGSKDRTIRQWDTASGEVRGAPLTGHIELVLSVSYSGNGKWLASGDDDGTIRQWDAESGEARGAPLTGHTDPVKCVSYSVDGKWLASGSADRTIRQWQAAGGTERGAPLTGHRGGVTSVSYSADGKWLVSGSRDKTIRQWHAASGETRGAPLTGHSGWVNSVCYSVDGKWLASGSYDKTIRQWDAESGDLRGAPLTGHTHYVNSVSYSSDGKQLVSGSDDRSIRQWDAESGEARGAPLTGHTGAVRSVSYSSDGKWLASGSGDHTIRQWELMPKDGCVEEVAHPSASADAVEPDTAIWRLSWGTKSTLMQLSGEGMLLGGAIGLEPHQLELLRQHGYKGKINLETGQIEDESRPLPVVPEASAAGTEDITVDDTVAAPDTTQAAAALASARELEPEPEAPVGATDSGGPESAVHEPAVPAEQPAIPEPSAGVEEAKAAELPSAMGAGASAAAPERAQEKDPAPPAREVVPAIAQRGSELLLSLAPILKRSKLFSPSHKLRDNLNRIYQDPAHVDNTYVSEDMLRSSELALTEKQLCKFARVNLNAARESSSAKQVKDALDLFEVVVGKEQSTVYEKVAHVLGKNKQEKYFCCLLFGRHHLAELSDTAEAGVGAGHAAASPRT